MLDIFTSTLVILVIFPILYFTSRNFENVFSLTLLILISIPTIMAMVNGAPYVPTSMPQSKKLVKLAKLKKGQKVYDIGCGDGRIVYIAANEYGANAVGIELSPLVYLLALIRKLIWRSKAKIVFGDFKMYDISDADIIFCYLLPEALAKIQPDLDKKLKPGTKIYSHAFKIPNWELIDQIERDKEKGEGPIWVYQKN